MGKLKLSSYKRKFIYVCIGIIGAFILASYFHVFYRIDRIVMDALYQRPSVVNKDIKMIAIDERSLEALGPFGDWERDIYAQLITQLNSAQGACPEIIAFDITFSGEMSKKGDDEFAQACQKSDNVIIANDIAFERKVVQGDVIYIDPFYIDHVEEPYQKLYKATTQGFADALIDHDGKVRTAMLEIENDHQIYPSFAYQIVKIYSENHGLSLKRPQLDHFGRFGFTYTSSSEGYEAISFIDVLNGKIDSRIFKDSIVLVGAYSSGMRDNYFVPSDSEQQMYGVEIQANIIQALLDGKTFLPISSLTVCIYVGLISTLFLFLVRKMNMIYGFILLIVFSVLHITFGLWLYSTGRELQIVTLIISMIVLYVFTVVLGYIQELTKKNEIVSVFKRYVAPQVVEEIIKMDDIETFIKGHTKDIAVMFVDIRGFTSLSEKLDAKKVVEILNIYLELTTQVIFEQKGTLDKFIGDAAMAVFNSPLDLDDYVYRAVKTAWIIASKSEEVGKAIEEKYGTTIGFGVGVNCGEVVIGNVGSKMRMNFTAIGDVVNTAQRLESQAKAGQVLISPEMKERLKDRIETREIGLMTLKGKSQPLTVYEVYGLKGEK